jgi:RNA polymerase sigma factor (sigma-70 family)
MKLESRIKNRPRTATDDEAGDALGELVAQVSRGNDAALENLYNQTIGKVYGLALAITRSREDAEEVACDVYTQVWVKARDFNEDRGSVMAWLMTICRSRSLDMLRSNQVRPAGSGLDFSAQDQAEPDLLTPEVTLARFQQNAVVTRALGALSQIQQQAVMLAFFHGSSHGDVAATLDLPLGTVKSHLRRALQSLHNSLDLNS